MKVKLLFEGEDYLILSLMAVGLIIAVFGLYVGIDELTRWLSGSLSQIKIN